MPSYEARRRFLAPVSKASNGSVRRVAKGLYTAAGVLTTIGFLNLTTVPQRAWQWLNSPVGSEADIKELIRQGEEAQKRIDDWRNMPDPTVDPAQMGQPRWKTQFYKRDPGQKVFRGEGEPLNAEPGDMWINPTLGIVWQRTLEGWVDATAKVNK
jgi:hypothetical protein